MRLLSTQGQGAAAYIAIAAWTRPASPDWVFGFECRIFSLTSEQIILGNSANNTSLFAVSPDGSLKYRDSGVDQITSAAGVISPNTFYTFVFRRVGSIVELWLGPPGMKDDLAAGTKIGQTSNLTQALFNPVNQFGRYYNSSTNTAIEVKRLWTIGGSYTDKWTPAGVHGTNTGWNSNSLSRFLTITNAAGATNSWWTQYPNASAVSKVGSGWPVDEVDYLSVFHWMQELKTSSVYVTAHCKGEAASGSVTTPTIAASDFPAGCLIKGDVEYNGNNQALLTTWSRQIIVAASSGLVTIQDFALVNTFGGAATANATNANKLKRLYIRQAGDPGSNSAALMVSLDAVAENCVAICTLSTASKVIRPSDKGVVRNCVGIGATVALLSEWTSSKTEKSYGVGSSNLCCYWQNGRPAGNITNASEDGSGDVGFQNLSPVSNFVDYANGDYRIRTSSPLHAAGIGAFFEESATPQVTGTFSASAVAGSATSGMKVALGRIDITATASAAVAGLKIVNHQFSATAHALTSLAGKKLAAGTLAAAARVYFGINAQKLAKGSFAANAVANVLLLGGNTVTVGGTFSASAVSGVVMTGKKVAFATFAGVATPGTSVSGKKIAVASPQAGAVSAAQAAGYKIGRASFNASARAVGTMSGYNASIPTPITEWVIFTSSQPAAIQTRTDTERTIHTNS